MLSRLSGKTWMGYSGGGGGNDDGATPSSNVAASSTVAGKGDDKLDLPSFRSLPENNWYLSAAAGSAANPSTSSHHPFSALKPSQEMKDLAFPFDTRPPILPLLSPVDSAATFHLNTSAPVVPSKATISSLLGTARSNPSDLRRDATRFLPRAKVSTVPILRGTVGGGGVVGLPGVRENGQMAGHGFGSAAQFSSARVPLLAENGPSSSFSTRFHLMGFDASKNSSFLNKSKVLRPVEIFPEGGGQQTPFQKRAVTALRQNHMVLGEKEALGLLGPGAGQGM